MDIAHKYNFYIGTDRGFLINTVCDSNKKINHSLIKKSTEVSALEWGRTEDEILLGFKSGDVFLYNTNENSTIKSLNKLEGEGPCIGIDCINKSIIVGRHDGIINIWTCENNNYFSINLEEKATLDCCKLNYDKNQIATGGEFNNLKLWDINTKQCTFKAKSIGHDELDLEIHTSIRDITFLSENNLIVTATKEGYILAYDIRTQRKPIVKYLEKKASFVCLSNCYRDKQCLAGTTRGYMQLLDLKSPVKCLKTFTDFTGCVSDIICDPSEPLVITVSLDRFLRVHDLDTKKLISKIYLQQHLTKIISKRIVKEEKIEDIKEEEEIVDQEFEDIFNNLETISEDRGKRHSIDESFKKKKKLKKIKN